MEEQNIQKAQAIEVSEAVRSHISLMNEKEREELLARIEQEKTREAAEKKKKGASGILPHLRSVVSSLFQKNNSDLDRFSSSDFADMENAQGAALEGQEEEKKEDEAGEKKQEEEKEGGKDALKRALDNCGETYAIVAYGTTQADLSKEQQAGILQTGIDVLGVPIYPIRTNQYVGIIGDCWSNGNAMDKLQNDLKDELAQTTGCSFTAVTLGTLRRQDQAPAMYLQRVLARLQTRLEKEIQTPEAYGTANMQELVTRLRKEIEENAIEQARRQFEQQMEENGELVPEDPVVIREAANMSPAEYDSYLSEEEQIVKREAKSRYIDDDVSIAQVLHNIEKHRTLDDPLYLIAIASVDMNTLVILEDTEDFETLCHEAGVSMIQCSYIYAISRSGGHWYGNNHATKDIENIFDSLSAIIVQNGGRFRKEYLYSVPGMSIFKDIWMQ